MDKDPVRIGRINIKVEKALGYDFGENIFCYISEEKLKMKMNECLRAARQGAVLVSPAISKGEKAIMRAAFEEGLPLVYLQENGFTDLAKPGGMRMDACARGQLLILAPWEHHNEKIAIKRGQCLVLNEMAKTICEG